MSMSKKEYDMLMESLDKHGEELRTSKKAARKLLISLGLLTTRGTTPKYNRRRKFTP
jgi:hypothetical protein